jgi:hypothetical protein
MKPAKRFEVLRYTRIRVPPEVKFLAERLLIWLIQPRFISFPKAAGPAHSIPASATAPAMSSLRPSAIVSPT